MSRASFPLCEEELAARTCGEADISGARGEQSTANTSHLLFFQKKKTNRILKVHIIFCFQTGIRGRLVDTNSV